MTYIGYKNKYNKIKDFHEEPEDFIQNLTYAQALPIVRHSFAHVLAQAVKRHFNVNLGVGPDTEYGFFFDFYTDYIFKKTDLELITKEMKKIISENIPVIKKYLTHQEALDMVKNDITKTYIVNNIKENLTVYIQGDFFDICGGPHVLNLNLLDPESFCLDNISEIMWNGYKMQRITGIAFENNEKLINYVNYRQQAIKIDHKILGQELNLFKFFSNYSKIPFWKSSGIQLKENIKKYLRNLYNKLDFYHEEVETPPLFTEDLWKKTGHLDKYKENMFCFNGNVLKPMNCPAHSLFFQGYMENQLPLRIVEFGNVFRNEEKGAISGLKRNIYFTQDDCHIFLPINQLSEEIKKNLQLMDQVYKDMDQKYHIKLATRPEKYIGEIDKWNEAERILKESLKDYIFEIVPGDGAFYGPKIEFHVEDKLGRFFQCGTLQLDFHLGELLNLSYRSEKGSSRPIIIHRAILGSFERFIALCLDTKIPFFLHPHPIIIIPVSEKHHEYAKYIQNQLFEYSVRVDLSNNTLAKKIKLNHKFHTYFTLVLGDDEVNNNTISIRNCDFKILDEFKNYLKKNA